MVLTVSRGEPLASPAHVLVEEEIFQVTKHANSVCQVGQPKAGDPKVCPQTTASPAYNFGPPAT